MPSIVFTPTAGWQRRFPGYHGYALLRRHCDGATLRGEAPDVVGRPCFVGRIVAVLIGHLRRVDGPCAGLTGREIGVC